VRSGGYLRRVGAVHRDRPAAAKAGSCTRWLLFAVAAGWLLLAATISFVPKPRPADGLPTWKLVVWLILFLIGVLLVAFIWKGGENQVLRRRG
jgi:peptidoglycan/LPS O-acetylase OafA/YrhL